MTSPTRAKMKRNSTISIALPLSSLEQPWWGFWFSRIFDLVLGALEQDTYNHDCLVLRMGHKTLKFPCVVECMQKYPVHLLLREGVFPSVCGMFGSRLSRITIQTELWIHTKKIMSTLWCLSDLIQELCLIIINITIFVNCKVLNQVHALCPRQPLLWYVYYSHLPKPNTMAIHHSQYSMPLACGLGYRQPSDLVMPWTFLKPT